MGRPQNSKQSIPLTVPTRGERLVLLLIFLLAGNLLTMPLARAAQESEMGYRATAGHYSQRREHASQFERRLEYMDAIGYGQPVSAELTPEVVGQVWEFAGAAGDDITIAMVPLTDQLDPFLLLLTMDEAQLERLFAAGDDNLNDLPALAEELGALLTLNDDSEAGIDSLIASYTLPADGTYFILATSCCTGDTSGPYELMLNLADSQPPDPPGQVVAGLRSYSPRQGAAGSEQVLTLEGEGFSDIGSPLGVAIGGQDVPLLDFELVDDQTMQLAIQIPEDLAPGEHEISFFFGNASFDGPFFVTGPEPGDPVDPFPVDPGPVGTGPGGSVNPGGIDGGSSGGPLVSWLPVIVGGGLLLLLLGAAIAGLAAIRLLRGRRPPTNPPPAAPSIRFEHDWDAGRQTIEPAGRSLRPDVDIRFQLSAGKGRVSIDDGES